MILKFYELQKIKISSQNLILFYGNNEGLKKEEITKLSSNSKKKIYKYDEKQIIENPESFFESLYSGSLFDNEKFIIINKASDKILKIIDEILEKKLKDTSIILNANILDKKSKLRSKFEKDKNLICVAFYPDNNETLSRLVNDYIKIKNISLSQMNINFIVNIKGSITSKLLNITKFVIGVVQINIKLKKKTNNNFFIFFHIIRIK